MEEMEEQEELGHPYDLIKLDRGIQVMPTGIVVSFVRGAYGFIKPDDGGPDLFVHDKAVERGGYPELQPGMRVRFQVVQQRDGRPTADDIVILGR